MSNEDPAVKLSVSMPTSLYSGMLERMAAFNIKSPSRYFQILVERDMREKPREHTVAEVAKAPRTHQIRGTVKYGVQKKSA